MVHSNTAGLESASVSVIVLAYNEAKNIPQVVKSINLALKDHNLKFEIIIVNDGSTDDTIQVVRHIANQDSNVRMISNKNNMGCGYTFMRGIQEAQYDFSWLIPGDGEITTSSISEIAKQIGSADMIIPYVINAGIRPKNRRLISNGYTKLVNFVFDKRIRYFNGPCVIRSELARSVPIKSSCGFAFMAPIILTLLMQNHTYTEIGIYLKPRVFGKPTVNNYLNILSALRTLASLYWSLKVAKYLQIPKYI